MADDLYYGDTAFAKRCFSAYALDVTAPVIWSTAAGTGGPLVWNNTVNVHLRLIKVGFSVTVASTVAGALGIATGVTTLPSSTTAIDATGNLYAGGPKSGATAYRIGTVSTAASNFFPIAQITTAALTTSRDSMNWIDINRLVVIPPTYFMSLAGSATLSTTKLSACLIWEEIPV